MRAASEPVAGSARSFQREGRGRPKSPVSTQAPARRPTRIGATAAAVVRPGDAAISCSAPYERRRGRPAFECPLDTGEGSRFVAKDRSYRTPVKRRISPRGSSARRAGRDGRQAEPGNGITAPVDSWISPMTPSSNPAGRPEARALEAKQNTPWLTDRFRSADDPTNPIRCGFKAHGRACVPCAGAHDAPARG